MDHNNQYAVSRQYILLLEFCWSFQVAVIDVRLMLKHNLECLRIGDSRGALYRGSVAVTTSGRKCQQWGSHEPNKHYLITAEE